MTEIRWNSERQLWETEQADLFSELWEPYSETWPTSGTTVGGRLLPLPMSGHRIGGKESSSLPALPTPRATDGTDGPVTNCPSVQAICDGSAGRAPRLSEMAAGYMLPIPRATDGTKGGPNQRGSSGDLMLPSAVMNLDEPLLLPTPVAQQSGNPPEVHLRKKPGRSQVTDLAIVVENGLLATGGRLADAATEESTTTGSPTLTDLTTADADDADANRSGPPMNLE